MKLTFTTMLADIVWQMTLITDNEKVQIKKV